MLDAAIPLIRERGPAVTTRELAEAAGVAEGTLFRVFEDKVALIEAAVERALDPEPVVADLRALDLTEVRPLLVAIAQVIGARARGIAALVVIAMQLRGADCPPLRPSHRSRHHHLEAVVATVAEMLGPHAAVLRRDPDVCARTLVGAALTASGPMARDLRLELDDLTTLLVEGMVEG